MAVAGSLDRPEVRNATTPHFDSVDVGQEDLKNVTPLQTVNICQLFEKLIN